MKQKNKLKIIITGSEGLLGKEISKFLENENKVIRLDLALGHDLTDEKFVKEYFKKNKADCLVNCFALNDHVDNKRKKNTLFNITLDSFSKFLEVNLTALFSVCREFARNNNTGSIVNFSASTGLVSARPDLYNGSHKHIAYSISKAGVINLTKFLSTQGGVEHNQDKNFIKKYSAHTPMKRMMKKDELNNMVEFLCKPSSSYVTGATFVVDGGWTTW